MGKFKLNLLTSYFGYRHVFLFPMGVAVIWMEDRVIGFEGREYIAGVHLSHRIISAIFSQSCIILIQIGIFLGVMYNFYDVEIKGSWVLAVGLIYSCGITGLILGKYCKVWKLKSDLSR